ncbi:MAG: PorT family protein [Prevotella sp.]|jgi:hypothetical protein|nr:PorT family protein [Prevotella sp.]
MKKVIFFTLLALMAVTNIKAQSNERDSWDIFVMPKVGSCYSNFTGVDNGEFKFGFIGGLQVEVFFNPQLAFDTEISFSHQGSHNYINPATKEPNDARLNYLNMDYLLRVYPFKGLNRFSLYTGIHGGDMVWCKIDNQDKLDYMNKGDIGIPVGIGYEFGHFAVDARYIYSFRKLAHDDIAKKNMGDAKLMTFALTIGYKIQVF